MAKKYFPLHVILAFVHCGNFCGGSNEEIGWVSEHVLDIDLTDSRLTNYDFHDFVREKIIEQYPILGKIDLWVAEGKKNSLDLLSTLRQELNLHEDEWLGIEQAKREDFKKEILRLCRLSKRQNLFALAEELGIKVILI